MTIYGSLSSRGLESGVLLGAESKVTHMKVNLGAKKDDGLWKLTRILPPSWRKLYSYEVTPNLVQISFNALHIAALIGHFLVISSNFGAFQQTFLWSLVSAAVVVLVIASSQVRTECSRRQHTERSFLLKRKLVRFVIGDGMSSEGSDRIVVKSMCIGMCRQDPDRSLPFSMSR